MVSDSSVDLWHSRGQCLFNYTLSFIWCHFKTEKQSWFCFLRIRETMARDPQNKCRWECWGASEAYSVVESLGIKQLWLKKKLVKEGQGRFDRGSKKSKLLSIDYEKIIWSSPYQFSDLLCIILPCIHYTSATLGFSSFLWYTNFSWRTFCSPSLRSDLLPWSLPG